MVSGQSLSRDLAAQAMEEIMTGEATPSQIASFITALRMKGETVEEIAGLAGVMRAKAARVQIATEVVDTCGTGGDGIGAFNVSTAAAFVAAGAGLTVAKHGNRAASSRSGSADVLEALGVKIDLGPDAVKTCLEQIGFGFMFAPVFHPAMKHAAGPRREIGVRTVFNLLGPLTNPAGAKSQVLGVADGNLIEKMARALSLLGCRHVLVVHGEDGMDEVSLTQPTTVCEVRGGETSTYQVAPEDFGMTRAPHSEIEGRTPDESAAIIRAVLAGAKGPSRDIVLLNAAAALVAGDRVSSLQEGVKLAGDVIDRGLALQKLAALAELSQFLGK
ncbi:MAG: anthranilate phosphoribosyltransferase [Dehalococcoidia bacterium]|nr:anthranilate phosphoribosyltransferase [Dehalococcoidia bacterium]